MTMLIDAPAAPTAVATCEVCVHAAEHFCYPPDHRGSHCRDCHRSWTGLAEIHCVVCCRHFSSIATLDRHKDGVRCVDPATAAKDGVPVFRAKEGPYGVTWLRADERDPWRGVAESAAQTSDAR